MLHELLFSLLGFVGDIIIDDGFTFRVKDGFDYLRESERDLANRIAPLGWFFVKLGDVVRQHDLCWAKLELPRLYMASTVQAVKDLLSEFVADVSFLEQVVLSDGPMPLSQVLQHMQKYLLILPQLHAMLLEVEVKKIEGCRLLDYFSTYSTGLPVLRKIIDRIILRLRVVFVKQCFAWMVHGELEDPCKEFFVLPKNDSTAKRMPSIGASLHDTVLRNLFHASSASSSAASGQRFSADDTGERAFDWTTSYSLCLEMVPGSHVSPRIASKIVFAGKAVKLLQSSGALGPNRKQAPGLQENYSQSEAYRYLSSGATAVVSSVATDEPDVNSAGPDTGHTGAGDSVEAQVLGAFRQYVEASGHSAEDVQRFTVLFTAALEQPDRAVELLETAVEAVNDCISNKLWVLLRDVYGFHAFLQVIRSTYLLGRGELFQGLLDGILQLTYAKPPETLEMDNLLNWKVLRTSAKLVGLESDDSLNELITLRVNSTSLTVRNFALHDQDVQLVGAAQQVLAGSNADGWKVNSVPRAGQKTVAELCRPALSSRQQQFEEVWTGFIRKRALGANTRGISLPEEDVDEEDSLVDSLAGSSSLAREMKQDRRSIPVMKKFALGGVWVTQPRPVAKGFSWSATFGCTWNEVRTQLSSRHALFKGEHKDQRSEHHPFAQYGGRVTELGSVTCRLRGDRRNQETSELSSSALPSCSVGSLAVGVMFYAMTLPDVLGVRYFARLFQQTGQPSSEAQRIALGGTLPRRHEKISVGAVGQSAELSTAIENGSDGDIIWSDAVIDIDNNLEEFELGSLVTGSLSSASTLRLDVVYSRTVQRDVGSDAASVATQRSLVSPGSTAGSAASTAVVYALQARLVDASMPLSASTEAHSGARSAHPRGSGQAHVERWGLEVPVNLINHVKCQGGEAFIGLTAAGLVHVQEGAEASASDSSGLFSVRVHQLHFAGKGSTASYPVTSVPTAARHPDTAARVQEEVDRVRAWMHLRLQLAFPPMFRVIFDAEAVASYERVFALIMKVRVVAHALERLWIARSRLASDRSFCQSRHSMHFFVSNLLYYLQVDVVDSEHSTLQKEVAEASDFQSVLRAHKSFTANIVRLSLLDNVSVQDSIDRILHTCLRFIAICRIMHRSEFLDVDDAEEFAMSANNTPSKHAGILSDADRITMLHAPIYMPPEELDFIRRDFFGQVSVLFQLMRKVESRGFVFRLDFNSFLSGSSNAAM